MPKIRLNLGCGNATKNKSFIHCDKQRVDSVNVIFDMDAYHYPFKDNSIDVVVAAGIVGHLKHPIKFYKELNRIMKKEKSKAYILSCGCKDTNGYNSDVFLEKFTAEDFTVPIDKRLPLFKTRKVHDALLYRRVFKKYGRKISYTHTSMELLKEIIKN